MHRSRYDGGSGEEGSHDVESGRGGMGQGGEEDGDGAVEGRKHEGVEAKRPVVPHHRSVSPHEATYL